MTAQSNAPPVECVVDTNVAITANGGHPEAGEICKAACGNALHAAMKGGRVFIDDGERIVREYRANLNAKGQPGAGDIFLKWLLTNQWGGKRVVLVAVTPKAGDATDFEELATPVGGVTYDPSDRKFLAVAAAHPDRPAILQATDSKWWGWRDSLAVAGIKVHFMWPGIEAKFLEKSKG